MGFTKLNENPVYNNIAEKYADFLVENEEDDSEYKAM